MTSPVESNPLAVLRRLRRADPPAQVGERCDLCATAIDEDHRHLVDVEARTLLCACRACALLFENRGAGPGRYRCVPTEIYSLGLAETGEHGWESLQIPVNVAFFLRHGGSTQVSAFYPGPAGATESLLPLGTFEDLGNGHPAIGVLQPDVEGLLVRSEGGRRECYIVPVDVCYELAGLLRQSWRGFDGGPDAHRRLAEFFERLRQRARPVPAGQHG